MSEARQTTRRDCCAKALATDCDVVLLCEPPGFRPAHYQAAVEAGKHVFLEKPVCIDAPGYRKVMAANQRADEDGGYESSVAQPGTYKAYG